MSAWNVSVLTNATSDSEPTLVVNFGTAKYIINASEGMGRAWMQSHHGIRKTKGVFLTADRIPQDVPVVLNDGPHHGVVEDRTHNGTHDLRCECPPRRKLHVLAKFEVLKKVESLESHTVPKEVGVHDRTENGNSVRRR